MHEDNWKGMSVLVELSELATKIKQLHHIGCKNRIKLKNIATKQ